MDETGGVIAALNSLRLLREIDARNLSLRWTFALQMFFPVTPAYRRARRVEVGRCLARRG